MSKRKGDNQTTRLKRAQTALELLVKYRLSSNQIMEALKAKEPISDRTAKRAIADARQMLCNVGTQPSDEERGLLKKSVAMVFAEEYRSEKPDRRLLNECIRTELQIHKTHHDFKGVQPHATQPQTQRDALSTELKDALKRSGVLGSD